MVVFRSFIHHVLTAEVAVSGCVACYSFIGYSQNRGLFHVVGAYCSIPKHGFTMDSAVYTKVHYQPTSGYHSTRHGSWSDGSGYTQESS